MKLLNFIKKNVLLVAAFATVIGFSAFKTIELSKSQQDKYWFDVDEQGNISSISTTPDPACQDNDLLPLYCSVAFSSPTPPVNNMADTDIEKPSGAPTLGVLHRDENP